MLDLVPLRGPRREVADRDQQPGLGRQGGQFTLPDVVAVAVGAARVRGDQQPRGLQVVEVAARSPPAADGLDGEHAGVVVDADVDPAAIVGKVIDPIRDRLLHLRAAEEEAVVLDLNGFALRAPLPSGHRQPTQLFPLLGVHADHRLASGLMVLDLGMDVVELGVPIWMLGALERLDVRLQAEPRRSQQPPHRRSRHRVPLLGELLGQMPQRLRRPPQRGLRVTPLVRLDQPQQCAQDRRVVVLGTPTTTARRAHAPVRPGRGTGFQFS